MAAFPAPASGTGVARAEQLVLRATVSAYLGRYRGETRMHTESDLRVFLRWCTDQGLDPLAAARVDIERCMRWLRPPRRRRCGPRCSGGRTTDRRIAWRRPRAGSSSRVLILLTISTQPPTTTP